MDEYPASPVEELPAGGHHLPDGLFRRRDGERPSVGLLLRLPLLPKHVGSNRYGRQDPAPASPVNVSALLTAATDGDRAAWNALVERFTPLVWATVRAHRLSDADAADVVQTTWLRLVEHLGRIQEPDRLGAWLATTARRESLRIIAAGGRVAPTDELEDVPDRARGPLEATERRERDAAIRKALSALGDRCELLLRLLANDPPPAYEEISSIMEMPIGSIGPTRGRCLARLRAELELLGIRGAA